MGTQRHGIQRWAATLRAVVLLGVLLLGAACASPGAHPRNITLTLIRHAESTGSAAGLIDTAAPGPHLTELGQQQARDLVRTLARDHDGIFASDLIRTQETAAPLSEALGQQVHVLAGLRDIPAGRWEGAPEADAESTLLIAPKSWLAGDRTARIPGSISGDEFNDRFTGAVQHIYDSGASKPVAFSDGAAIMWWTLMNVKNAKPELLTSHPLHDTARVVVTGNPVDGWTLVEWDGLKQTD